MFMGKTQGFNDKVYTRGLVLGVFLTNVARALGILGRLEL